MMLGLHLPRRLSATVAGVMLIAGLLLSLEQQGRVLLTPHAQPEMLTFSERQQCISTPRGLLYLVRLPSTGAGD
jgi:hypothetical protein